MGASIYIADDEKNIRDLITKFLECDGYSVTAFETGDELMEEFLKKPCELVILDIMMPGTDGLTICRQLRTITDVPIIMLTAKDSEYDYVRGITLGGDDYLTKPFSVAELLARVRVALRRVAFDETEEEAGETYRNGDLAIDFDAKVVVRGDDEIHLTPIEYKLLVLLARNTGKVLTHNYILKEVWGQALTSDLPSLRVFMATLRKKIEPDPASPVYLQTHVGIGYRMLRVE